MHQSLTFAPTAWTSFAVSFAVGSAVSFAVSFVVSFAVSFAVSIAVSCAVGFAVSLVSVTPLLLYLIHTSGRHIEVTKIKKKK